MDQPSSSSLIQFDNMSFDVNENPTNVSNVMDQTESDVIKNDSESDVFSPSVPPKVLECVLQSGVGIVLSEPSDSLPNTNLVSNTDSAIHESKHDIIAGNNDPVFGILPRDRSKCDTYKLLNVTGSCNLNLSNTMDGYVSALEEVNSGNEVFRDAVEFFRDPASVSFLENAGNSASSQPFNQRSSLFMNFDPLLAQFKNPDKKPSEFEKLEEIAEDDSHREISEIFSDADARAIVNKHVSTINASPYQRHSIGQSLMTFDSPVVTSPEARQRASESEASIENKTLKVYNEDEMQQALKMLELSLQDQFIKTQKEIQERISRQNSLYTSYHETLKELSEITYRLSEEKKSQQENMEQLAKENENQKEEIDKLKEDLKTSVEDLQSVENTFADFHKRYEQCKSMLKVYTQNEGSLKQKIENLNIQLQEKEEMYNALQVRTEEIVDKANQEVATAKKSGEAQSAVLKAQLKKAELKISSLESDVKYAKMEKDNLSSICDELMAKVSET